MVGKNLAGIVISETHWDRAWYLTFQQFRLKLIRLLDRLIKTLEEDDEFTVFTLDGQTVILEDYLEVKPNERPRLEQLIANGRIEIGPWYVLPDVFLVSGEALIRNLLRGNRVAQNFGRCMDVGYIPDPFGLVSQLPQILSQFGYDSAIFARGTGAEVEELKSEFLWQAPDGSEVYAHWLPGSYGNIAALPDDIDDAVSVIESTIDELKPWSRIGTYLLMNGSDHLESQAHLPRIVKKYNETHDDEIIIGNLPMFVELMRANREKLKHFTGEFRRSKHQNLLSGVYSTRVYLKQANEYAQRFLERMVEPWCTAHYVKVGSYPLEQIRLAWMYLLRNHPHDDICGCSIDEVHDDMMQRFRWVDEISESLLDDALAGLADSIRSQNPGIALFNPSPYTRSAVVNIDLIQSDLMYSRLDEVQLVDYSLKPQTALEAAKNEMHIAFVRNQGFDPSPIEVRQIRVGDHTLQEFEFDFTGMAMMFPQLRESLRHISTAYRIRVDEDNNIVEVLARKYDAANAASGIPILRNSLGDVVPTQVLDLGYAQDPKAYLVNDREQIIRLALWAEDIRGLGIKKFDLDLVDSEPDLTFEGAVRVTKNTIENGLVHVKVNQNGTVSVTHKPSGQVYEGLLLMEDAGDVGDEYDFAPIRNEEPLRFVDLAPSIAIRDEGPLVGSLEITGEIEIPAGAKRDTSGRLDEIALCAFTTLIEVRANSPNLHITLTFDNQASDHRFRVLFPTHTRAATCDADSAFDVISRPVRPEGGSDWVQPVAPTYPLRSFVSMSDNQRGMTITTEGLLEFEILDEDGGTIALTLLRAVGWLSKMGLPTRRDAAGPILETPDAQCLGENTFHFAITLHENDWLKDKTFCNSENLLLPMHGMYLPPSEKENDFSEWSLISIEPSEIRLSALKLAERGTHLILRVWNISDTELTARINLGFEPNRVRRVWLDETDRDEEPSVSGRIIETKISGKHIATILIELPPI